jgi:conjugation transfer TcpE-like protein
MAERLIIRSYRRVFEVDRRIYRVDRWAVPVPGGVPLLGVGYFAGALLVLLLAAHLPVVGGLVVDLSPPLRFVVLPLAVAVLGLQAAPDGRVAHRFARDWLALRLRTRRRSAGRTVMESIGGGSTGRTTG